MEEVEEVEDGKEGEEAEEVEEGEEVEIEEEEVEEVAEQHKCINKFLGKIMISILRFLIKKTYSLNSVLCPFSLIRFGFCNAFF